LGRLADWAHSELEQQVIPHHVVVAVPTAVAPILNAAGSHPAPDLANGGHLRVIIIMALYCPKPGSSLKPRFWRSVQSLS
jgi:hypothetical protein